MRKMLIVCVAFAVFFGASANCAQDDELTIQAFFNRYRNRLGDQKTEVRLKSVLDLNKVALRVSSVAHDLGARTESDRDPKVRAMCFRAMANIASLGRQTHLTQHKRVLKGLKDENDEVRQEAINFVGAMAPYAKDYVPLIIPFIKDKNPLTREVAMHVMASYPAEGKDAVPLLIEALRDETKVPGGPPINITAARVLGKIGPDAKAAAEALKEIAKGQDDGLSGAALEALVIITAKEKTLLPYLVQVLRNKDQPSLRSAAAVCLAIYGKDAKETIPDLLEMLKAKDIADPKVAARTQAAIIHALGRIGEPTPAVMDAIQQFVDDPNQRVSDEARLAMDLLRKKKSS